MEISQLFQETLRLSETKTDLKLYSEQIQSLTNGLHSVREIALNSESKTQTMIEFIYKFEPIYIQRQITQALSYVFPDATIQWRLNWFNEIKMPVLTTLLLYKSDFSLEENMAKFRENLKVESLTQAEILVKSAMKNHEMHEKAVNIITAAMDKIMN